MVRAEGAVKVLNPVVLGFSYTFPSYLSISQRSILIIAHQCLLFAFTRLSGGVTRASRACKGTGACANITKR